jgi:hypothetical protein
LSVEKVPVGSIRAFLEADHRRLEALLDQATALTCESCLEAYEEFRAGLLKHIAMEEKILLSLAKEILGNHHPVAKRLSADHSLLATLLIPTPTPAIIEELWEILAEHNVLEEGDQGVYQDVERLAPDRIASILDQLLSFRQPTVAKHVDSDAVWKHIEDLRRERLAMM